MTSAGKPKLIGLRNLAPYLLKHKLGLLLILICSLLKAALSLLPILFVGGVVDALTEGVSGLTRWIPFLTDAGDYVIGFAIAYLLHQGVSSFCGYYISVFTSRIIDEVRQDAFSWSLYSFRPHRETKKASDVVSRITGDVEGIMRALAGPLNGLLPLLLQLVGSLIILALWSKVIALVALVLMALIYVASIAIAKRAKLVAKEQRIAQADLLGAAADAINNIPIIKVFQSEKHESECYRPYSGRIRDLFNRLERSFLTYWLGVYFLMGVGYIVTLALTIKNIALGLQSAGSLPIAYSYMANILTPMVSVSRYQNDLYQADAALARVFQLKERPEEPTAQVLPPGEAAAFAVEFRDVAIDCSASTKLAGLSFRLAKNQLLVLLGSSGQGKSTVIQALLNNQPLTAGNIFLNGRELKNLGNSFYPYIGVSFQNSFLFERSLGENIAYSRNGAVRKRFDSVNPLLGLDALLQERGVNYNVGAQGKNLSGGERKRVSMARALDGANKALYIFDEPTAELDAENRKQIIGLVADLKKQATVIVATHDEDFLTIADVVVDLNQHVFGC